MAKGNFDYNYPKVIDFLKNNGYEYHEFNDGQHLKIFGDACLIDLWPSRMKYHIIQTEGVDPNDYLSMNIYFSKKQLKKLLQTGSL